MTLNRTCLRIWACIGLLLVLPLVGACGGNSTASAQNNGPVWGFPFKTGTTVTLGSFGLHDDNFSADGGYTLKNANPQNSDDPTHANEASLDLLPAGSAVPVYPLASGTVLAADVPCHFILIDHGNDTWVAYLHINVGVTKNKTVTRETPLGTTASPPPTAAPGTTPVPSPCGEHSDAEHVHFAFLTGHGTEGSYVSMVNRVLCGYQVIKNSSYSNGALQELADTSHVVTPGGKPFQVKDCPASSGQVLGVSTSTSPLASPTATQILSTPTSTDPVAACRQVSGFANARPADTVANQFISNTAIGEPTVPFAPNSLGYVARTFSDPEMGRPDLVINFEIVAVCSPAITPDAVRSFFTTQMPSGGWSHASTFPYGGDTSASCGDPYCWDWVATASDAFRFASLESVHQAGMTTIYELRLGAEAPA